MNQNNYAAVRSAGSDSAAALALGESPWAGSHYAAAGGAQGSLLDQVIAENNLTQYDSGQQGSPATNILSIPNPANIPGGIISAGANATVNAVRPLIIKGVLLAGGVILVVLAGWKATTGARQAAGAKLDEAAKAAAVAA
jgi:hypothetical protein